MSGGVAYEAAVKTPRAYRPSPKRDGFLLGVVFLVYSISTVLWSLFDQTPPSWDPADHLLTSYRYFSSIQTGRFVEFFQDLFDGRHLYPPLVHLINACFLWLPGGAQNAGIPINVISLAI